MFKLISIFVLIFLLFGCLDATKIAPQVSSLNIIDNMEALERGRNIYLTTCTKCHNALRITRYSQQQWRDEILPSMSEESSLTSKEQMELTLYVNAVLANSTN
jgi:cytochrome c